MKKIKLFVLEDDKDTCDLIKEMLDDKAYDISFFHYSREVMELLKDPSVAPDVMIVDFMLPDGRGIVIPPKIKEVWPKTKVIVYTGMDEKNHEFMPILRYTDRFLRKTAKMSNLVRCIEDVLSKH